MPPEISPPHSAIDLLYKEHSTWLFRWLRKKLASSAAADDLVQDTFVRIITSRQSLMQVEQPRAYLVTVAKRLMIDQARRKKLEEAYLAELALTTELLESCQPSVEDHLILLEALEQIAAALAGLSEKTREIFILYFLDGKSQKDIATETGLSDRMIRKHLSTALLHCHRSQRD